jgi:hypothetical protein
MGWPSTFLSVERRFMGSRRFEERGARLARRGRCGNQSRSSSTNGNETVFYIDRYGSGENDLSNKVHF